MQKCLQLKLQALLQFLLNTILYFPRYLRYTESEVKIMVHIEAYTGNEPYIFVSYSHKDAQVQTLMKEMAANGFRFWYDEGIKSGRSWSEEISRRLKGCCQFVVFLTPNAVASENVKDEIHIAKKYKIDLQVIYLEETVLDDGLELMLDRTQGILLYKFGDTRMRLRKLVQALKAEAQQNTSEQVNQEQAAFLQRYEIFERKQTGSAFTELLTARQISCNANVFIKHYTFTNSVFGSFLRQEAMEELALLQQLRAINCPYVPTLIDSYVDTGNVYIAEQYLGENTLEKALESFNREDKTALQKRCVSITVKIAKALRYLHDVPISVVHRDVKPANLFLGNRDTVHIVDFGACMSYTDTDKADVMSLGTLGYASPEQHGDNRLLDPRADIHALGITLVQMLTEEDPRYIDFDANMPLRQRDKKFDPGLEEVIQKMTAYDANDRYQNMDQVIHALETYQKRSCFSAMAQYLRSWKRLRAVKQGKHTPRATPQMNNDVTTVIPAWQMRTGPMPVKPPEKPRPVKPRGPVPSVPPKKPQPIRLAEPISITPRPGKNTGSATDFLIQEDES